MEKNEVKETEKTEADEGTVTTDPVTGRQYRKALMLRQLLPDENWIMREVVSKGKGTKVWIGRIVGQVTATAKKNNALPDGSFKESTSCSGTFESESYLTGEIVTTGVVYFPQFYAEAVALELAKEGVQALEVDIDIGLEATGRSIPYAWTVKAYIEGEQMDVIKRIKSARGLPADAAKLAARAPAAQIAGPK